MGGLLLYDVDDQIRREEEARIFEHTFLSRQGWPSSFHLLCIVSGLFAVPPLAVPSTNIPLTWKVTDQSGLLNDTLSCLRIVCLLLLIISLLIP